jgi:hypothetical protein
MKSIGAQGGMSLSSGFDVEFDFTSPEKSNSVGEIKSKFESKYYKSKDNKNVVHMLCDEAQLPNVQSGVAQITGKYLGQGPVSYPHTRIFTDLSLGFMLDADLTPLKFFNEWYNYIFSEELKEESQGRFDEMKSTPKIAHNRTNRLKYLDQYACTLKILKTEPGVGASNERSAVAYFLEECYPYSIDAVPLAYGSSQITRLTVNFYYSRHTVKVGDVKSQFQAFGGGVEVAPGVYRTEYISGDYVYTYDNGKFVKKEKVK